MVLMSDFQKFRTDLRNAGERSEPDVERGIVSSTIFIVPSTIFIFPLTIFIFPLTISVVLIQSYITLLLQRPFV